MHEDYQNRGVQRLGAIYRKVFDAFHLLCFLYNDELAFCHHGETPRRGHNLGCRDIGTIADGFVEVFLEVLQAVVDYGLAYQFGVVGLIAHKQIYRGETSCTDVADNAFALLGDIYVPFGHICTKLQKNMVIFVNSENN